MRSRIISIICVALAFTGCGEYNRVLKSTDYAYKYEYAKRCYAEKKYTQASTILEMLVPIFRGTDKAEESLYLLGMSHYENGDYMNASSFFKRYYTQYPRGQYAEMARYYSGYGYYLNSPDSQLDQTGTLKAIEELQAFLDYFPKSDKVTSAQNAIFELQDKLVFKELENAQLYYNLGSYMGNNYDAAAITAKNAMKDYPYTKYKEQLEMIVLKSRFKEAELSVEEKKEDRFRTVLDEYYAFINDYPNSKDRKEADNIFKIASKYLKDK